MRKLLLGLILASACSSTEPTPILAGRYDLATVNGHGLPIALESDGNSVYQMLSEQVTLNADGTFTESAETQTVTVLPEKVVAQSWKQVGSYTVSDSTVSMVPTVGDPFTMTWRNGQLSRFIPRKQYSAPLLDLTYQYQRIP